MKVAILTWLYNQNYGTLLQAYALQRVLKHRGYEVENINFHPTVVEKVKNLIKCKNSFGLFKEKYDSFMTRRSGNQEMGKVKDERFSEFLKSNFSLTNEYNKPEQLEDLSGKYNAYICGSDQIWSPMLLNPVYYFNFLADSDIKIAYACSFGVSKIPNQKKEIIGTYLSQYDYISVREEKGQQIVEELTDKEVPIAVDPTILLSVEEWQKIAHMPEQKGDYIFVYFLSYSSEYEKAVQKLAEKLACKVVIVPIQKEHYNLPGTFVENAGPQEWLGLILNAKAVITDSFHGCIFSLLFQKDFYVERRFRDENIKSQNSRIYTLLKTYECEECLLTDSDDIYKEHTYDWMKIKEKMAEHSLFSEKWLVACLNGTDDENEE